MSGQNTKDYIQLLEDRVKGCNEVITDQQQKIEELQKENTKLKEQLKELENLIKPCLDVNTSDEFETASYFQSFVEEVDKLLTK